jgi:excisionase family DNA binding protein
MSEPLLLRIEDVARQLQISRSMAYLLIQRRQLPAIRLGRSVRVPQDALVKWVRQETATAIGVVDGAAGAAAAAESAVALNELFLEAGFDRLGERFTIKDAMPALKKLGKLVKGRDALDRRVVREECISRLTKAGVRTPLLMVDSALGLRRKRR